MRGDEALQTSEEWGFPCLYTIETIDIGIPQLRQWDKPETIGLLTHLKHDEIRKLILGFQSVSSVVISPIMGGGENNRAGSLGKEISLGVVPLPL